MGIVTGSAVRGRRGSPFKRRWPARAKGKVRGLEQPTRLRSSRCARARTLASPVVSIVRFGHVAMPEPVTGNGAGTARCIRPGGRRDSPDGQNSRWAKQVWEPEDNRMVAASRTPPTKSCVVGSFSQADLLDPKERPMLSGKKRTLAPLNCGGVRTQALIQGSQR